MKRMHRPELDPKTRLPLPADKQDKRSVVAIERANWDRWLRRAVEEARALLQLTPMGMFAAGPAEPEQQTRV
jgi:hypothetical protein